MLSDVQKKKIVHFFELLDSHKNGFLQAEDFSEIAERIRMGLGYEAGGEKHVFLAKKSAKFFHTLLNAISHENKQVISQQEWIDFIDKKKYLDLLSDFENESHKKLNLHSIHHHVYLYSNVAVY